MVAAHLLSEPPQAPPPSLTPVIRLSALSDHLRFCLCLLSSSAAAELRSAPDWVQKGPCQRHTAGPSISCFDDQQQSSVAKC